MVGHVERHEHCAGRREPDSALVTLGWDRDLKAWGRFAPVSGPAIFVVVTGLWVVAATVVPYITSQEDTNYEKLMAAVKTHKVCDPVTFQSIHDDSTADFGLC